MNVFRSSTISVGFYGKFDTCWLKNSQTRDQPTLARLRELTWQTWIKTRVDLRRRFCFPYLKYDANWSHWEMWFLQVFVMKTSISLFSSNEHEMNLNKRRRQLQSPSLGVLVFLCRSFLDFWFLLPRSWQLFLAKFARYCQFFHHRAKKSKKIVGVFSRQAKITKIFAKEAREFCIKVIQDYSSFSCILQQICYLQSSLMNQLFFEKPIFLSKSAQIFQIFWVNLLFFLVLQHLCFFEAF